MSYTCKKCGRTSHNPNDWRERYCGACHQFEWEEPGRHFTLDENNVPQPATLMESVEWKGSPAGRHHLAFTETDWHFVSTIFLGSNHNYGFSGPPILFETMAGTRETHDTIGFKGEVVQMHEWTEQERYCTYDEAMAGHAAIVAKVKAREAEAGAALQDSIDSRTGTAMHGNAGQRSAGQGKAPKREK